MDHTVDEIRFRDLFDRHHRSVTAYFTRRVPDETEVLSATDDVFLVAWRRLDDVPEGDGALPWLYGVARKVLANHRRGLTRFTKLRHKIEAEPIYPVRGPATEAILSVQEEQMLRALETLPWKHREVLLLTYWEQLPHKDIGRILGCSTETVHVRRYRAVNRLKAALGQTGQAENPSPIRLQRSQHVD